MNDSPSTAAPAPAVARPAATLILLRETPQAPEVLLLKRHGLSDVLGGAFVFPGGKVDADDGLLDAGAHLDANGAQLRARVAEAGVDDTAAQALFVAALREAFEESGLLLAQDFDAAGQAEALALHRAGTPFNAIVSQLGLRLRVGDLMPWSRWVTPVTVPKRFDTWFFVARAPEAVAHHDERETTETLWVTARDALARYWQGELPLAPPQIMTLAHLARHASLASVAAEAQARRPFVVQPRIVGDGEGRMLCYPGHALHAVGERAMPGPLHLQMRGKRYEPEGGFDAFFA